MRIILVSFFCMFLASCVSYKLVGKTPLTVKGMQVVTQNHWNKAPNAPGKSAEVWTIDGHQLNELIFVGEVSDNGSLFKANSKELPMPKFKTGMLPNELEDLVKTSLKNLMGGEIDVDTSSLRPVEVNEQMGFRFNLDFHTPDGLAKRGDVLILENDGKLYSVILIATRLHYFDTLVNEFEGIIQSLKVS